MELHRQVRMAASPDRVWRCLTEPALLPRWISAFVDETPDSPGPPGVGVASTMRLREGGKVVSYRSIVTAWEPRQRLAIRLTEGSFARNMAMDVTYDLRADADGTLLDYGGRVKMTGFFFRLMEPVFRLAAGANAKRDLAKLKALAESDR